MLTLLRETIEDILITWIGLHKKSSSIQTFVEDIPEIKSHWSLLSKTYRNLHFINSNSHCFEHFVFHPHDRLVPLHIFSYRESTVGAPISSLAVHKILFFFSWLARQILILKSTYNTVETFNTKQSMGFLYSSAKSYNILQATCNQNKRKAVAPHIAHLMCSF